MNALTVVETIDAHKKVDAVLKQIRNGDDGPHAVRVLGDVAIHLKPYDCDDEEEEYDDGDDDRDEKKRHSDDDDDDTESDGDHSSDSPSRQQIYSDALDALAKGERNGTGAGSLPVPRSAGLSRITDGTLAAASLALRDLAFGRPFTCGGRFALDDGESSLTLQVRDTGDGGVWHDAGTLGAPDIAVLLAHSVLSPFGDLRTGDTVHDEAVRRAREIPAERIRLVDKDDDNDDQEGHKRKKKKTKKRTSDDGDVLPWGRSSMVSAVARCAVDAMHPGVNCILRLHKVNLYGEGGFFCAHVDTPTGSDMVGTAVIALPVAHTGGALAVSHSGTTHIHDLAPPQDGSVAATAAVSWAALYGDCAHEVLCVESGHRVTLAFDMERERSDDDANYVTHPYVRASEIAPVREGMTSRTTDADIESALRRLTGAVDAYFGRKGDRPPLGIVMSHRYAGGEPTLDGLKGVDRVVADALARQRSCRLVPVLVRRNVTTPRYGYDAERESTVVAFTADDLRYMLTPGSPPPPPIEPSHYTFIDMVDGRPISSKTVSGCEYTGNEACPPSAQCVYFSVALLLGDAHPAP